MDAGVVPASSSKKARFLLGWSFFVWVMRATTREGEPRQWRGEFSLLGRARKRVFRASRRQPQEFVPASSSKKARSLLGWSFFVWVSTKHLLDLGAGKNISLKEYE